MVGSAKPTLREACAARSEAWLADVQALVDKSVSDLERQREKLAAREAALDARAAALTAQVEALAAEKAALLGGRGPGDVLRLSVAGQECVVLRRTLCQVEGSMLASQFSGRWDDSLAKDDEGRIFVDAPPDLFLPIVDWLRQKAIEDPSKPIADVQVPQRQRKRQRQKATGVPSKPVLAVQVPQHRQPDFDRLVDYYGLAPSLAPADAAGCATWLQVWGTGVLRNGVLRKVNGSGGWNDLDAGAICHKGFGTFVVRNTDADQPWHIDSFRVGLIKDASMYEAWRQASRMFSCNTQLKEVASQYVRFPHSMFSTSSRAQQPAEIEVSMEVLNGDWKLTFRNPDGIEVIMSTRGGQGSWHIAFAVSYDWIEVALKSPAAQQP